MPDRIEELQFQIKELENKLQDTSITTKRLETMVDKLQLSNRTDPAIALGIDLIDLGNVPTCGVHKVGDQDIVKLTWTEITFGTTTWDTDQMADLDNNGITIRRAGVYLVTCTVRWEDIAKGTNKSVNLVVNDTISFGRSDAAGGTAGINAGTNIAHPRFFDIGDTLTANVYHDRAENLAVLGSTATLSGPQLTATLIADTGGNVTQMA